MSEDEPLPEPTSMDELLSMSAEELGRVEPYCYQSSLSATRLIRGMIRLLDNELEWRGEADSMSLRGLWYSGVKTALQNAFPEKWNDPDFDANRRYSQYLSETLSAMVKDGEVTYRGLNIVDDSRQRQIAADTIEDDKILFVEKEAAYRRLLPIQQVFELSLVSGGGWEATALIEDMAHHLEPNQSYQLFVLSDYDPTGYRIAEDFERRAKTLGVNITRVERIGIEPHQVSDHVRDQERFQVPRENDYDEEWLRRHGIDGRYGLEIEAIGGVGEGGRPLREIVVDALSEHLRYRDRRKRDTNVAVANTAYWAAETLVDELTQQLKMALLEESTARMEEIPAVTRCYPRGSDGTSASVDFDAVEASDHRLLPRPLEEHEYDDCAIDAPTTEDGELDVVRPSFARQRDRLKADLQTAINEGEIDLAELLLGDN